MQAIETIIERMRGQGDSPAIYWNGQEYSYRQLLEQVDTWRAFLDENGIGANSVCGFVGEYTPQVCALIFALMQQKSILVPFTPALENELQKYLAIAGVEHLIRFDQQAGWNMEKLAFSSKNALISSFQQRNVPGLVVFSSGSTGEPKGILQDCECVMKKFVEPRPGWRTVLFLMLDHFGGFNTLLSTFAYGGTAVCLPDRNPETVCKAIEGSQATLLPTTPTFINLLLASRSYLSFDLSSIKIITYGTEVMPDSTLTQVRSIFRSAQIKQTYGLSELGVLRSKSESDNSLWVKVGGKGFETKVMDNVLWVRSEANMVGYLNAPDPFDAEGWMCTGDHVEVRGEYMRILGRKSEIINVGGQKVFPPEVESVILQDDNVRDVTAFAAKHSLLGSVVHARVSLNAPEDHQTAIERLRKTCVQNLTRFKIPVKFIIADGDQHSVRFKKDRKSVGGN